MPRGGIAISVLFPTQSSRYKPLSLRLPKKPATMLEGTTDTPEYRILGRVAGRDVEVRVDIRERRPSKARLSLAQRIVSAIRFG
jgi:hypothetical protein